MYLRFREVKTVAVYVHHAAHLLLLAKVQKSNGILRMLAARYMKTRRKNASFHFLFLYGLWLGK